MPTPSQAMRARSGHVGPSCKASVLGPLAARTLRAGALGRLSARFEHSFYLELGAGFVCVGEESLGPGPLRVRCVRLPAGPLGAYLNAGDAAHIEGQTLVAGALRIDLAEARPWWPAAVGAWDRASLLRGLAAAKATLRVLKPRDGLLL